MLQALSIVFALAAVVCIGVAVASMVRGDSAARNGFVLRIAAVVFFAIAVVLNVAR